MSPRARRFPPDAVLGEWHRWTLDDDARAIDLDLVGECACGFALYAIEGKRGTYERGIATSFLYRVAMRCNVPGYLVMYEPSAEKCGCSAVGHPLAGCDHGIAEMKVRRVWPVSNGAGDVSPAQFAEHLTDLRSSHIRLHHPNGKDTK